MNIQKLMKQAQQMQTDMKKQTDELKKREFEIKSQGITVTISGDRRIKKVDVPKEMHEDSEMLIDLITVAINNAIEQVNAENAKIANDLAADSGLSGMF